MDMHQHGAPSVEEILASIKQVIARDAELAGPGVLDLAAMEALPTDAPAAVAEEPLLAADTRDSMRESLAALAAVSGPRAAPQIVRSGETSLEAMVRELLRPALAEWLDQHLPALVERMVAAEIARIVGKKA